MKWFVSIVLCTAFTVSAAPPVPVTTVILMRHAEKDSATMDGDPPLSAAGIARAKELARVLANANVDVILTTPYRRTRDTVKPLADATKVQAIDVPGAKTYAADVAAMIRTTLAGKTVVVVGHSNTTPAVLRELGIANPPSIAESQHDDLFIVTLGEGMVPRLLHLNYGGQ